MNNKLVITKTFSNPTGREEIFVGAREGVRIVLEDLAAGSREFCLEILLDGDDARCEVLGRMRAVESDEKSWTVVQKFSGKNQVGSMDLRAVGKDESCVSLDGKAVLGSGSQGGCVEVRERAWLFDGARGRAVPVLRVETDDVGVLHHRASVTGVDEGAMFFLLSRGVVRGEAEEMLVGGFLNN